MSVRQADTTIARDMPPKGNEPQGRCRRASRCVSSARVPASAGPQPGGKLRIARLWHESATSVTDPDQNLAPERLANARRGFGQRRHRLPPPRWRPASETRDAPALRRSNVAVRCEDVRSRPALGPVGELPATSVAHAPRPTPAPDGLVNPNDGSDSLRPRSSGSTDASPEAASSEVSTGPRARCARCVARPQRLRRFAPRIPPTTLGPAQGFRRLAAAEYSVVAPKGTEGCRGTARSSSAEAAAGRPQGRVPYPLGVNGEGDGPNP